MTSEIPQAQHSGPLTLGAWVFRCHVLSDNRRIIAVTDFLDAIDVAPAKRHTFLQYLESLGAHPLTSSQRLIETIENLRSPILFRFNQNLTYGYEAETFVSFCSYLLELRRIGVPLSAEEKNRAEIAEKILISIANVGLIALIDEATGYQSLRPRDALQILLDKYLRRELAAWAKTFPDEFYIEMFRLKGWEWKGMKINRPQVVGYQDKHVYARAITGNVWRMRLRRATPVCVHTVGLRFASVLLFSLNTSVVSQRRRRWTLCFQAAKGSFRRSRRWLTSVNHSECLKSVMLR